MKRPLAYCLVALLSIAGWSDAASQERARVEATISDNPTLPLPIQTGARWLRYALLAPLGAGEATCEECPAKAQAENRKGDSPEACEINAVRERLGGSVVRGRVFDGEPSAAADQAHFDRFIDEFMNRPATADAHYVPGISEPPANHRVAPAHLPVPIGPSHLLRNYEHDPLQAASEQLRASARNLDSTAADLEDAGKYEEADRLRVMAGQLRSEAREFSWAKSEAKSTAKSTTKGVTR